MCRSPEGAQRATSAENRGYTATWRDDRWRHRRISRSRNSHGFASPEDSQECSSCRGQTRRAFHDLSSQPRSAAKSERSFQTISESRLLPDRGSRKKAKTPKLTCSRHLNDDGLSTMIVLINTLSFGQFSENSFSLSSDLVGLESDRQLIARPSGLCWEKVQSREKQKKSA